MRRLTTTRLARHRRPAPLRWCALVATLLFAARGADAAVAVESYIGPRPEHASVTLAPLLAELEAQHVMARPETVRAQIRDLARPGVRDPSITLTALIERIDEATKLLHRRSYGAAAGLFESALADAHANVALLVADPARSHTAMMDAWIGLATCRFRLRDQAGAEQAMQEAVRSFPNQELNVRNGYGMEPAERYRKAAKQLQARGSGKLIITVNDPSALIFVNEWDRPQNAIFESDALPGPHRVLVQLPGTSGWRHDVVVMPNEKTQLHIDVRFDAAAVVSDAWVGFSFPSADAARGSIVEYATRLVGSSEHKGLIVVSLTRWNGQPVVLGSVYRIDTGAHLRSHVVALDGRDDDARLRALARALTSPDAAALLADRHHIAAIADPFAPLPLAQPAPPAPGRAKWALLGGAVLAAGAGVALVYLDDQDRCGQDCSTADRTKPYGYASLAVAGLMAAGAGYLFYRDARPRPPGERAIIGLAPAASGICVIAAGRF